MNRINNKVIEIKEGDKIDKCQVKSCINRSINIIIYGNNMENEFRLCRHHSVLLYDKLKNYLQKETGEVNVYKLNPSMIEDFWFAENNEGKGTKNV